MLGEFWEELADCELSCVKARAASGVTEHSLLRAGDERIRPAAVEEARRVRDAMAGGE